MLLQRTCLKAIKGTTRHYGRRLTYVSSFLRLVPLYIIFSDVLQKIPIKRHTYQEKNRCKGHAVHIVAGLSSRFWAPTVQLLTSLFGTSSSTVTLAHFAVDITLGHPQHSHSRTHNMTVVDDKIAVPSFFLVSPPTPLRTSGRGLGKKPFTHRVSSTTPFHVYRSSSFSRFSCEKRKLG